MFRRAVTIGIGTSCLILILAAGAGFWGIHQGLIHAPTGIVRLGQVDVMAFSGIEYSTVRSPRAYYTVWVGLASEPTRATRPWRPLVWARRLIRLSVPPPAVLMR